MLAKYMNFELMFDAPNQKQLGKICKQVKFDLLLQNQMLTNIEILVKEANISKSIRN